MVALFKGLRAPILKPLTQALSIFPLLWLQQLRRLNLDFINNGGAGVFDPRITATRNDGASVATFFGSDGLLKIQGYNLLTYSQDLPVASWSVTQATRSTSSAIGPVGDRTVCKIVFNSATSVHYTAQNVTTTGGVAYTFSFYAKKVDNGAQAVAFDNAPSASYINYDLVNGVCNTVGGSGFSAASITPVGDGWYRCQATMTNAGSWGQVKISITDVYRTANASPSCVGDGVSGVLICGAQLEAGSTANLYSPTTTAANSAPRIDYDPATPAGTTGVELATNGDFSNGTTGWTANNGTITPVSGAIQIINASAFASARQTVAVTAGKTYRVTFSYRSVDGNAVAMYLRWVGFEDSTSQYSATTLSSTFTTVTVNLVAASNTLYIRATTNVASGACVAEFDNISVQEVTFAPRGWLIEESRTNLAVQSNLWWDNAGVNNLTSIVQTQVGIAGSANEAWIATDVSGANTTHYALHNGTASVTLSSVYTASAFVKAGTMTKVQLFTSSAISDVYASFDLSGNGSLINSGGTSLVANSAGFVKLNNGWFRLYVAFTASATSGGSVGVSGNPNSVNARLPGYTGAGSTWIVQGAQVELGSTPSSYIPTTTQQVIRAADVDSMTLTNFSSWYNQTQGTFVVEGDVPYPTGVAGRYIDVNDGFGGNTILVTQSTTVAGYINVGGVAQCTFAGTVSTSVVKSALAYATNDVAYTYSGTAIQTDTTVTLPTVNRMDIGFSSGTVNRSLNGHIRRITYYPVRLPNAVLQALTA